MNSSAQLVAGLDDAVHESQQAFRQLLDALARPGQPRRIGPTLAGVALGGAMARLLLSLCDDETPVWWQQPDAPRQDWLRFHTGADVAGTPADASFAVISDLTQAIDLSAFCCGTASAPEFSTTLLIELPSLQSGPGLSWRGPGIRDRQVVALAGLPASFWPQWADNHAAFPQGVDIVFTCADFALGLPRSTRVSALEEV